MNGMAGRKAVAGLAALLLLVAVAPGEPQLVEDHSGVELLLDRAVAAANAGKFAEALRLYQELERSSDPSYAWAGTSGQVIVHRMAGDGASARAVTQRIAAVRPGLAGLMAIWDGDTAMVEKDVERALGEYRRAADIHGRQVVDGQPIGVTALRQLSRARFARAVVDRHAKSFLRERARAGGADPARGARHEGELAIRHKNLLSAPPIPTSARTPASSSRRTTRTRTPGGSDSARRWK